MLYSGDIFAKRMQCFLCKFFILFGRSSSTF
uniref:Uncharacterized protein n=1 Tax=Rhizophora mucronata TaxID=61149 RepID=A0A2P2NQV9_RHIMU